AAQVFGASVAIDNVIGETLRRTTPLPAVTDSAYVDSLRKRITPSAEVPDQYEGFATDPLSSWIESALGVTPEPQSGRLVRQMPRSITGSDGVAKELAELTGTSRDEAASAIRRQLLAGYHVKDRDTGFRVFAFRLHQFI